MNRAGAQRAAPVNQRLDAALVERGLAESRAQAQALVLARAVRRNGEVAQRPAAAVAPDDLLEVDGGRPYVGRGGEKLAAALDAFALDVSGWVCADVGASTGGFTDALLQRAASRVYAIDVGYGQLAWKLRGDQRVVVMERTNARALANLPETVRLAVIDVSFISLRLVLPAVRGWLEPGGEVVALVKPQFEAGRERVGRGGVIRDESVRQEVLDELARGLRQAGWSIEKRLDSPIRGARGNLEQLWQLLPGGSA